MKTRALKEGEILRPDFGRKKAPEKKTEPEKEKLKSFTVAELKAKATWLGKCVVTKRSGRRRYVVTTAHFYGWGKKKDGNIGYMIAALGGGDAGSHDSSSGQDNIGQNWVVDKDQEIVFTGKHANRRQATYTNDLRRHEAPSVFDAGANGQHVVAQIPMTARATRVEDWAKIMFQSTHGRLWARLGRDRVYGYIARPTKGEPLHIHAYQKGQNKGPTTDKGEFKDLEAAKAAFRTLMKSGELDESATGLNEAKKIQAKSESVPVRRFDSATGLNESQPWLQVDKQRDPFEVMREECNAIVAEEEVKDGTAQSLQDLDMHTASPRFKNALHALKRKIDTLTPEQQKKVRAAAQRIYGESVKAPPAATRLDENIPWKDLEGKTVEFNHKYAKQTGKVEYSTSADSNRSGSPVQGAFHAIKVEGKTVYVRHPDIVKVLETRPSLTNTLSESLRGAR